ncbi:hypothetical protein ACFT2C_09725 [Promicromonospora sp. NPDC057138]|uniref:hypothetical protein n=1 Tax=Promicromonospora sp. NPDC057138 TaxID=3346031 RepID=UPI003624FBA4
MLDPFDEELEEPEELDELVEPEEEEPDPSDDDPFDDEEPDDEEPEDDESEEDSDLPAFTVLVVDVLRESVR